MPEQGPSRSETMDLPGEDPLKPEPEDEDDQDFHDGDEPEPVGITRLFIKAAGAEIEVSSDSPDAAQIIPQLLKEALSAVRELQTNMN